MPVRQKLKNAAAVRCGDAVALDVRIGLRYTAVKLSDGRTGVAYTMRGERIAGCSVFRGSRPLAGKRVDQLLAFLESSDRLESSVGLAACNAICNVAPVNGVPGDILTAVELLSSDRVVMVGFFGPLVPTVKKRAARLEIFEEVETRAAGLRSASEACAALRACELAIITSTAVINNTIDSLLDAAKGCREVILLGPSTPFVPEAFDGTPVTMLSGIVVDDPNGLLCVVSEGCGTRFFGPCVTKWNVRLRRNV
ncbi:MAG: DUF364 domain-containing protein [Desulfomonile sp.]|nr:DUF364 domain-containing protein [Desulfomonile sp.]